MYNRMSVPPDPRQQQFLRLFMANESVVRAFVRSLVPTLDDANDVMQEVAIVLWEKFTEYDSSEDFRRWAFGVAKFKVLSWQRDQMRDRHVFGIETTELLAADLEHYSERLAAQRDALQECVRKLPANQQELLHSAYAPGIRIESLAVRLGSTAMAVYKKLHRIRVTLSECVRRALQREEPR
jgi:RNA polymerase sigma-70 factor (ECF subfamily)